MKRTHLLIALLAAVGLAGCGPDDPEQTKDNPDNGKAPKILIKETDVAISSEGESKRLTYEIENAVGGERNSMLTLMPTGFWISHLLHASLNSL